MSTETNRMNSEDTPINTQEDISKAVEEAMENRPKRHNLEPFKDSSRTRVLRFWLNVIFMLGAIAGLIVYFKVDHDVAKYILLVSCVFKFVELGLRILKI